MEVKTTTQKPESISRLSLENQKKITVTGVVEIISSNDNSILLKLNKSNLLLSGSNIHITKLDVQQGILEADGIFSQIRYNHQNTNLFKRIFK